MKKTALALAIMLFTAANAFSAESMKAAIDIVEDFSREANILMKSRDLVPPSPEGKDRTVEELKQIRLTRPPGRERSDEVYSIVSSYTGDIVESVRSSDGRIPDRAEVIGRLEDLRSDMLKRLSAVLSPEAVERKEPTPVPSLDLSPHDEPSSPDNEKGGILFR